MRWTARLASVWRTLVHGRRLDADLDDELRAYVEALVARRIAAGEAPYAARRAVLAETGGLEQVKERVREVRMGRSLEETIRDVAYAWRSLRRAPGLTAAALTTLALGVGATIAIFSVAWALLVRPLPFRDADRLVFVWADQATEGYPRAPLSGPELQDLDDRARAFEGFGGIWATTAALTSESDPEQLRVGLVTSDFFTVLGAEAALGRTFRRDDDSAGPPTAILLGASVWQRRYGGDPGVVGRSIEVNGRPTVVVGVMPQGFRPMMPPDAAVPDDLDAWLLLNQRFAEGPRGQRYLRVIGRLRSDASVADGVADVARVGREISAAHAFYGAAGRRFETVPLRVDAVNDVRRPLQVLAVGALVLLLIACINVGALLVARAASRGRETAVKTALGAGRVRVVRQAVAESLLLGIGGAALGLVSGSWLLAGLQRAVPDALGRLRLASLDVPVTAAAVAIVLGWMAVLALAPAMQALGEATPAALHQGRGHTGGRRRRRLHVTMTVAQLTLSVVLVVTALLLARTVQEAQAADLGFEARGALTFRVALPGSRYPNQEAFNAFSRRLQDTMASLPGVAAAAALSHAPYDHVPNWGGPYLTSEGGDASTAPQADYRAVAPGAFELLGARLLDGRTFTEDDDSRHALVAVVDERLARRAWPGAVATGRRLAVDPNVTGEPTAWATVIGVVKHVRHRSPVEEVRDQVYFSSRQVVRNPSVYVLRTSGDPAALVAPVREAVRALDPALPIYDVRPLAAYLAEAGAIRAFTAWLAMLFAAAALLLATVGVYGVVAYAVTERRREFGVRVALGASARQVLGLVLGESAAMAAAGLVLGLGLAAVASWWLRTQLVGVSPWDPLAMLGTAAILAAASLLAAAGPARRAVRMHPADVLREG